MEGRGHQGDVPAAGEVASGLAAAQQALATLVPPLRFAVKDGFAGAPRLRGFGELARGAIARARAAGAPSSPALERLAAEAEAFDALPADGRRGALARIAGGLSALIPVPEELREIARLGRTDIAASSRRVEGRGANPAATASGSPEAVHPERSEAASAAERSRRTTSTPTPTDSEAVHPERSEAASAAERSRGRRSTRPDSEAVHPERSEAASAAERSRGTTPTSTSTERPLIPSVAPPEAARSRGTDTWTEAPPPRTPAERAERRKRLATPLAELPRAHPATRAQFEERGRATVEQALEFFPKAYQDRTQVRRIAELRAGDTGIVHGTVRHVRVQRMRNGRPLLKVGLSDPSGALELVFFNPPPWRVRQFAAGDALLCSGKVTEGFGRSHQMSQPEVEKLQAGDSASFGRIVPIYAGPADYQHPALRKLVKRLVDEYAPLAVDDLPPEVRARRALLSRAEALARGALPAARDGCRVRGRAGHTGLPAARLRGALLPPARAGAPPARRAHRAGHRLRRFAGSHRARRSGSCRSSSPAPRRERSTRSPATWRAPSR